MKFRHLVPLALASIVSLSNAASPGGMPVIIVAIHVLGDVSIVNADQTSNNIQQKEKAHFPANNDGNVLSFLKGKILKGVESLRSRNLLHFHKGIRGGGYNKNDHTNESTIVATKSTPRKLARCSEDYIGGSSYNLGDWVSAAVTTTSDPVHTRDPNTGLWNTETTTMTKMFNYKCTSSSWCGSMGYGPGEIGESASWEKEGTECSGTAIPVTAPTLPLWSGIGCPKVYAAGTDYDGGDVVSVDDHVYQCAAEPSNLWCGMTGYEPGNSQHWKSAWEIIGSCSGMLEPTESPSFEVLSNEGGCPTEYEYGGVYDAEDKVSVRGFIYQCKSWPQSLHCSQAGFEPGLDSVTEYWKQAWVLVARCSRMITPTSSPNFNSLQYLGRCPQEYILSGAYTRYKAGDLVTIIVSSNPIRRTIYECRAFPFDGYCRQGAFHPTGPYGRMGWNLKGHCDTAALSSQPSANPSASSWPTLMPSYQPSAQKSTNPSLSSMPSGQPSDHPSVSDWPTSQPSESPSLSGRPSSMPSNQPSSRPSIVPSSRPSSHPSSQPSSGPSAQPSSKPSSMPSEAPSVTVWPSSMPSESPSTSAAPSSQPSEKPSVSDWPTSQPSLQPSAQKSTNPSLSSMPSGQPSDHPSVSDWPTSQPSESPSLSGHPSSMPSNQPSSRPSIGPSSRPSSHPFSQPSSGPSAQASSQPSSMPSEAPSVTVWPSSMPSESPSTSAPPTLPPTPPPTPLPPNFVFDDFLIWPGGSVKIPNGYRGLYWDNWYVIQPRVDDIRFQLGTVSGDKVSFNAHGYPCSMSSTTPFSVAGFYATGVWRVDMNVLVESFDSSGNRIGSSTTTLGDGPTSINLQGGDFDGIFRIRITPSGGTPANYNAHVAIDDMVVSGSGILPE